MCSKVFIGTFEGFCLIIPELLLREVQLTSDICVKFMAIFCKIVIFFLGRITTSNKFLDFTNKENNKVM